MMKNGVTGPLLIAFFLLTIGLYLVKPGGAAMTVGGNTAQTIAGLLAAVYLFRTALAFGKADKVRPYWLWLAVGYVLNALGFLIYAFAELVLGPAVPSPSWADLCWIASYPALIYGSFALLRSYATSGLVVRVSKASWGAAIVVFLLAGYFLMWPIIADGETGLLEKMVLLAYPVGDALLFAASFAVALMMRQFGAGKLGAPWTFIALGMIAATVSDMVYT
ncbi:MAG: hypothetical protein ACM3XM_06505, partial [Mycobacterium leprae]